ncbi:hypothetical protein [Longirhabdus pacifica]|uniref:hypothetical protein n=1 Tax=Longirhabdus pacifica TaxID=2305227 RepID=UPI001008C637|nr:hypothetical protein [Longirhabdus pacifica]
MPNQAPNMVSPFGMMPNQAPNMVSPFGMMPNQAPNMVSPLSADQHSNMPHASLPMILDQVSPWVEYGMKEAKKTSYKHAMTEVGIISYLLGMGYDPKTAYNLAEQFETNETYK